MANPSWVFWCSKLDTSEFSSGYPWLLFNIMQEVFILDTLPFKGPNNQEVHAIIDDQGRICMSDALIDRMSKTFLVSYELLSKPKANMETMSLHPNHKAD